MQVNIYTQYIVVNTTTITLTTTSVTIGLKNQRTLCLVTAPRFCYHLGAWLLFVMRSAGHFMHGARIGDFSEHVRIVTFLLLIEAAASAPKKPLYGWCAGKHSPRKPAQSGYADAARNRYCKACYKKKFPKEYEAKQSARKQSSKARTNAK
jgi:hypothetical protein